MSNKATWALVLLLAAAAAGGDDRREQAMQRVEANLQQAQERLQLSEEQVAQVRPILIADAEQRVDIVRKYATDENGARKRPDRKDMRAMRDEVQLVNERTNESLSRVLSEEQLGEYRQLMSERRAALREEAKRKREQQ